MGDRTRNELEDTTGCGCGDMTIWEVGHRTKGEDRGVVYRTIWGRRQEKVGQTGPGEEGGGVTGWGEKQRVVEEEGGGQALICKLSVSNYL